MTRRTLFRRLAGVVAGSVLARMSIAGFVEEEPLTFRGYPIAWVPNLDDDFPKEAIQWENYNRSYGTISREGVLEAMRKYYQQTLIPQRDLARMNEQLADYVYRRSRVEG